MIFSERERGSCEEMEGDMDGKLNTNKVFIMYN